MKKNLSVVLVMAMLVSFGAAMSSEAAPTPSNPIVLKMAHDDFLFSTHHFSYEHFANEVKERTDGAVIVEVYGAGLLGTAPETIEGMMAGTVELWGGASAIIANFAPEFDNIQLPYLFRDSAHAHAVADGEVGQWLSDAMLRRTGVRVLGYQENGIRNVFGNKRIEKLSDFRGVKQRVMLNDIHTATFEALGAIPVPTSGAEIFPGLQQGTLDTAENTYDYLVHQKFYEICRYYTDTEHFFVFVVMLMADSAYQRLTQEQQQIVSETAIKWTNWQREEMRKANANAKETLVSEYGMEFVPIIDRQELIDAVQVVYERFADRLDPEIQAKIEALKH